ncbi:membrane protein insertion efficiency factor YidD [Candidatus Curtissbacteria bacterium]|nr:membrane protein insertion efficiency factor YidD [Candidatus Curtissbacteria bacterium]
MTVKIDSHGRSPWSSLSSLRASEAGATPAVRSRGPRLLEIARFFYHAYHLLFINSARACRFTPTCSRYALEAVEKFGLARGSYLALKRLLSCQPFSTRPYYDPI